MVKGKSAQVERLAFYTTWDRTGHLKITFNWELELQINILILHGVAGNLFLQQGHICKGRIEPPAGTCNQETVKEVMIALLLQAARTPLSCRPQRLETGGYDTEWEGTASVF